MILIGKVLGNRYEILEEIGIGGMATVYKAKDKILNRFVAIKILKDEFVNDTEFIKRFQIEAQAAASLSHQNIVSVYDVGNEGDIHYIVMELIEGQTLKEIIQEKGKLPWREAVNIAAQICSGLSKAHANHIIHRDIKPHNIIITKDGVAKVTDFGIAKAVSNATINAMGSTVGSVHYFSPEHARGGYTDERSDIYSLGVVLYEMVTGQLPFDADTPVSVALKHLQEKPTEPIEINDQIPIGVNNIIMKAMSKEISERYQTAREMRDELENILKNPSDIKDAVVTIRKEGEFPTQKIPIIGSGDVRASKRSEEEDDKGMKKGLTKGQAIGKLFLFLVIAIALFVVAFTLGNQILSAFFSGSANVTVPKVIGMEQQEAQRVLEEAKLVMEVLGTVEGTNPAGYVETQNYKEGTELKEGAKVGVKISKGAKTILVPNVTKSTPDVAKIEIEQRGLVYQAEYKFSETIPSGEIIEQSPEKNTEVVSGSIVTVYISKGTQSGLVKVPNVIGEMEANASQKISDLKLLAEITTISNPDKADGIVINQIPTEGELLSELSVVTLVVNKIKPEEKEQEQQGESGSSTPVNPYEEKRLIPINLSNKGQRDSFTVKVTLESVAIGTRVEYEGTHTRADGTISVYVSNVPGAYLKLYIDGKLDSEQVLK